MELYEIRPVSGKGLGVVAATDIQPGTLLLEETPLLVLDPPSTRNELLKLLGCRLFSSIDMRRSPDHIRAQVNSMILHKLLERMEESRRSELLSLSPLPSPASSRSGSCSPLAAPNDDSRLWHIWQRNSIPLGSYRASAVFRAASRINHACRPNAYQLWCPELGVLQVWVVEPVRAGREITVSYIRTFCSRSFRQQLLWERFGFECDCAACALSGDALADDDSMRTEIDRLATAFAQLRGEGDFAQAMDLGERILFLMERVGFNSSVRWSGFLDCFQLCMANGDVAKARYYADLAYESVCIAKGDRCEDAKRLLRYKACPEAYLSDAGLASRSSADVRELGHRQ
jgi:hypothetical protein